MWLHFKKCPFQAKNTEAKAGKGEKYGFNFGFCDKGMLALRHVLSRFIVKIMEKAEKGEEYGFVFAKTIRMKMKRYKRARNMVSFYLIAEQKTDMAAKQEKARNMGVFYDRTDNYNGF